MKRLLVLLSITFLFALAGCGNTNSPDNSETETPTDETFSETIIGGETQINIPVIETEPTHTIYRVYGLTLEKPIDWRAFRHPTYDQIWIHPPSNNPRRRDQTRIQIFSEPVGERGYDLHNWFGMTEFPPKTELGGVEAYCGRLRGSLGTDNLGVQSLMPHDTTIQRDFYVFHNGRFFDIRFMCADGEHWETLEEIRDSFRFPTSVIDSATAPPTLANYTHPFVIALQEYFTENATDTNAILIDIDGNGTQGVFAMRSEEATTHGRVFYIYDGELFYKDFSLNIGYAVGINLENRIVKLMGDAENRIYTLFGIESGRLTESFALAKRWSETDVVYQYYSGGLGNRNAQPLTEEEFNAIHEKYGLDRIRTTWAQDDTERILAMTIQ